MGSEQRITYGLRCNTVLHCKILWLRGWQSPAGAEGRARPSTPSGAGEPGEDAEPAPSTPAPLRCAPQRASGAVGVASPVRGKRLTLQVSELLFVFSAPFLLQGLCQAGRCPDRRRALTELRFRGHVE